MLYWDFKNECVTTKKGNTSICKGIDDNSYFESWLIDDEKRTIINFSYTQTDVDMCVVGENRFLHFKKHKISPYTLRRLESVTIPKAKYEELEKSFNDSH